MFRDADVRSSFGVDDIAAARAFYGDLLGFEVVDAPLGVEGTAVPAGLELRLAGGGRVLIYPRPDHEPAEFTVLTIAVDGIDDAVDELTRRGVRFEHYETPRTDERGVHRDPRVHPVAWFRDPAGNILSLVQRRVAQPG